MWKNLENYGIKWKKILTFAAKAKEDEMVKFIGEYTGKLDDKGRVVRPAAFKSVMPADEDMKFVLKKDIFVDCLEMYTYTEWTRQSEEVKSKLNFFNRKHAEFWREYMRNRAMVEPDSKIGRITIPRQLLESIGVNKEVVFAGNDHKIEIWAKEKYATSSIPGEDFSALADIISEIG